MFGPGLRNNPATTENRQMVSRFEAAARNLPGGIAPMEKRHAVLNDWLYTVAEQCPCCGAGLDVLAEQQRRAACHCPEPEADGTLRCRPMKVVFGSFPTMRWHENFVDAQGGPSNMQVAAMPTRRS